MWLKEMLFVIQKKPKATYKKEHKDWIIAGFSSKTAIFSNQENYWTQLQGAAGTPHSVKVNKLGLQIIVSVLIDCLILLASC